MPIKASELSDLKDKVIVVQVEDRETPTQPGDDPDYYEITGKVIAATPQALAIKTRDKMVLVKIEEILDVEVVPRTRRLVRRWIEGTGDESVRQHLVDRHGLNFELVRGVSASDAILMHNGVDHSKLGHEHGAKPNRAVGRPARYARPED